MERVKVIKMKKVKDVAPIDTAKEFLGALDAIVKEKGIDKNQVLEAMELALTSAYKKNFHSKTNVKVNINRETGDIKVFSYLTVASSTNEYELLPDNSLSTSARTSNDAVAVKPNREI